MKENIPDFELEARFNSVIEEYGSFLRSHIARLCPKDLGLQFSDIEQEAHLRLWRALQSEREISDLASYLYRIAATATIDAVRRVKARREEQFAADEGETESEVNRLEAGPAASPERIASRRELARKLEEALARVAEDRRRAVALYLEGMTSQEIAGLMGWSEPRARNLTYRGLHDLRDLLKREGIDCEID
jgi:RNA polymerase sigma factor (sigma-70 family)